MIAFLDFVLFWQVSQVLMTCIVVDWVACFTPLVGFSPSGVVQICTVQVPFVCLLWLILIRCFFHDIYFHNVSINFVSGILQPCFQHVEHSRLKGLIQGLPAILLKSKPENTTKKYERGFNAWRKWASHFKEIVIFPASSVYFCLFFLSLIQESVSCSIVDEAHYGCKWFHDLAGQPDPCNSPLVILLLESAKRLLSVRRENQLLLRLSSAWLHITVPFLLV